MPNFTRDTTLFREAEAMKKLCIIFICITLLFSACTFAAFAAEEAETTAPTTEATAITTETMVPTAGEKTYSIMGHEVSEEAVENTLRWIFYVIVYILSALGILGKFKAAKNKMDDIVTAINAMIESYNTMSEACNKLVEAYEKHVESEASRDLILGALTEQGTAMLDILQFAYANSSKLPQGIKDVINLKYANALKTLADEEKLLALVKQAKGTDNDIFDGKADE